MAHRIYKDHPDPSLPLPSWVAPMAFSLLQIADSYFLGPGWGSASGNQEQHEKLAKEFTKRAIMAAATATDPDADGEPTPVEFDPAVVELVIELVWGLSGAESNSNGYFGTGPKATSTPPQLESVLNLFGGFAEKFGP